MYRIIHVYPLYNTCNQTLIVDSWHLGAPMVAVYKQTMCVEHRSRPILQSGMNYAYSRKISFSWIEQVGHFIKKGSNCAQKVLHKQIKEAFIHWDIDALHIIIMSHIFGQRQSLLRVFKMNFDFSLQVYDWFKDQLNLITHRPWWSSDNTPRMIPYSLNNSKILIKN